MEIRHIFLMLECYWFTIFCVPLPVLCAGNALGLFVCAALVIITIFWNSFAELVSTVFTSSFIGAAAIILISLLIIALAIYLFVLNTKMLIAAHKKADTDKPTTVIILGCRVKGTRPTRMLRRRLDAGLKALNDNPQSICIASGGKGEDEKISEAQAMKAYLIEKGLDESRIYLEDQSCSTYQNLKLSKVIIEKYNLPKQVCIATDGFHQYRASIMAKSLGINSAAISAPTEPRYEPTYRVREWLALTYFFIFQKNANNQ